jgi:hypothetical protein
VISSRTGAALSLVISVLALGLGILAVMIALREDDDESGRMVQTRLSPSDAEPALFALDEFYMSTGDDGKLRALYVYPPGYFGHSRGCRVEWRPFEAPPEGSDRPGLFVDPCGGSQFDRSGALIFGPAERGLDEFRTEPGIEGLIVDTSVLYCGPQRDPASAATPEPGADRSECDRVDDAP